MRKGTTMLALGLVGAGLSVQAETIRPLFTLENRILAPAEVEVGSTFEYRELKFLGIFGNAEGSLYTVKPYARLGVLPDLELHAAAPFNRFSPEIGSTENGASNAEIGFRLRAYQDIFGHPSVIPHVTLKLPTGDEDLGIYGSGDTSVIVGLNLGTRTTVYDQLVWNLNLTYEIFEEADNVAAVGISVVWELSERFAFLTETRFENRARTEDRETPFHYGGGLSYQASQNLAFTLHGAVASESQEDVIVVFKTALKF